MKKLTSKQQKFYNEYILDFNGTAAVIRAGYSEKGASVTANILLKNPRIVADINKFNAKLADSASKSREEIVKDLEKVVNKFLMSGFQTGQALKAIEILNKMLGFNSPEELKIDNTWTVGFGSNDKMADSNDKMSDPEEE